MSGTTLSRHKFPYRWDLAGARFTKDRGKVFSCFACGGGSTMGYKLAGFDVIGCNEIDPRVNEVYVANHSPKHNYCCDIRDIVKMAKARELPDELYDLDILDGSPPCSSFSISGNREKDWGKEKKFREGQSEQVLDTLFFDFIDLAKTIRPKVVVAENVKGLFMGSAIDYVRRIYESFDRAGYYCQHFLLNSSAMGVPQKRERVFFICMRKDIAEPFLEFVTMFEMKPTINMEFEEEPILWGEVNTHDNTRPLSEFKYSLWEKREEGDLDLSRSCARVGDNPNKFFNSKYLYADKTPNTVTGHDECIVFDEGRYRNDEEVLLCSSWPLDYKFNNSKTYYICGMSVPPVMMAQIASRIDEQWLSKIRK